MQGNFRSWVFLAPPSGEKLPFGPPSKIQEGVLVSETRIQSKARYRESAKTEKYWMEFYRCLGV
jgi:hypothetical protein